MISPARSLGRAAMAARRARLEAAEKKVDDALTPHVVPGLYVGPFLYAKSTGWLARHGVTHVVNATPSTPCVHEHIKYLRVAIEDQPSAPIEEHFAKCHAFVADKRGESGRGKPSVCAGALWAEPSTRQWERLCGCCGRCGRAP